MKTENLTSTFTHHTAQVNGVRLHYAIGGTGMPVVLLHGWPQTWYAWRKVMPLLAQNYTVIVPDLRGAGYSDKPKTGYDKKTLAADIKGLVEALNLEQIYLVGHDIGCMVAYAYARQYPQSLLKLVLMEATIPGIEPWWSNSQIWHYHFHQVPNLPEILIAGKEREYLTEFYRGEYIYNPLAISDDDINIYVDAYRDAGAYQASLGYYRTFAEDADQNRPTAQTKLNMPVLAFGGSSSLGELVLETVESIAEDFRGSVIANCGHFIPEEKPEELTQSLLDFWQQG